MTIEYQKQIDDNNIEEMNYVVQKALEMLLGAGGHKEGILGLGDALFKSASSLKNALKVGMGITLDHWHLGYKDVTMEAFRSGIQKIAEHYCVALKILQKNFDNLSEEQIKLLTTPEDREHILKTMGFSKEDRNYISKYFQKFDDVENIAEAINTFISMNKEANPEFREKQIQKVEFMLNGSQCYLPFAEPNDGHRIKLPVKNRQGLYELTEMQVELINMSKGFEGPYYALNLRATNRKNYVQDLTIFMGTNPLPTASGPSVTLHADSIPGMAVGENFVDASKDQFENLFKQQFKENLLKLINQTTDENEDINYEKIWLDARIKCVGQSLGGSIALQMLAKFPYMVEINAFESPFLPEHLRYSMELNLINAHDNFSKIVDELKISDRHKNALKKVISKDSIQLQETLKNNNSIVTQLLGFITKYGSVSPPAQIYHVDTDKKMPKYNKITDTIYKAFMAGSVMSHAMSLGGQTDKVIKKIDGHLSQKPRQAFTNFLHKMVWKLVNPPIVAYFHLKHFYLNNIHDPKMNPSKSPYFNEKNKELLSQSLSEKWKIIKKNIKLISQDENYWGKGHHLNQKFQELGRMIQRAESLNVAKALRDEIVHFTDQPLKGNLEIYRDLLKEALKIPAANTQDNLLNQLNYNLDQYSHTLQTINLDNKETISVKLKKLRQEILEFYPLLDKNHRKIFLSTLHDKIINQTLLVTTPRYGLLNDLRYCAQSPSEKRNLSRLIKMQDKQKRKTLFRSDIKKILNTNVSSVSKEQLNDMKQSLIAEQKKYGSYPLYLTTNNLAKQILINKISAIEKQEKINEVFYKEPSVPNKSLLYKLNHLIKLSRTKKKTLDDEFDTKRNFPKP